MNFSLDVSANLIAVVVPSSAFACALTDITEHAAATASAVQVLLRSLSLPAWLRASIAFIGGLAVCGIFDIPDVVIPAAARTYSCCCVVFVAVHVLLSVPRRRP